jgi:hypothetical protein
LDARLTGANHGRGNCRRQQREAAAAIMRNRKASVAYRAIFATLVKVIGGLPDTQVPHRQEPAFSCEQRAACARMPCKTGFEYRLRILADY